MPNVFDYSDQLTVEAWFKPNITTGLRTLWDDHGSSGVRLIVSSSRMQFTVATEAHPEPGRTVLTPLASIVAGRVAKRRRADHRRNRHDPDQEILRLLSGAERVQLTRDPRTSLRAPRG